MASQDPKTFLSGNIALLMGTGSPTGDAVQRKTQVGRGTVQRIKEGSTSTGTDTLLAIADAFGVEPGELRHPQLGKQTANLVANKATSPTLAQALEVVAAALSSVPVEKRQALLGVLATYASDPVQESNSLSYLQSELAKTQARAGVHPSSIATGQPLGGTV